MLTFTVIQHSDTEKIIFASDQIIVRLHLSSMAHQEPANNDMCADDGHMPHTYVITLFPRGVDQYSFTVGIKNEVKLPWTSILGTSRQDRSLRLAAWLNEAYIGCIKIVIGFDLPTHS